MKRLDAAQQNKVAKRVIAMTLSVVMCMSLWVCPSVDSYAATKSINVETAMNLGLKNSGDYQTAKSKYMLAKVQYSQAVKKLKLKKKNQSTLRWSPLLKFHFPEKANLADESEYNYKPVELQMAIITAQHKVDSVVYANNEKIGQLFCKIYYLQEKIKFNEERQKVMEETIRATEIGLKKGEGTQKDLDNMKTSLKSIEDSLKTDKTDLEAQKDKLSTLIGLDVRVNYKFANPFVDARITEDMVPGLQDRALEMDHGFYETKMSTGNSIIALNTNYSLMKNQYGGKMSILDPFVNQAKAGNTIDSAAFKIKYEEFLYEIDKKWQGKKRILFIKFPKDFLKGKIDGVNYVEDEPYALYENVLDYQSKVAEENAAKNELMQLVKDTHNNYVKAQQAVVADEENLAKKKKELVKLEAQNKRGLLTYEEYKTEVDQYESDQMDYLKDKSDLAELLYTYDKVTCGGITELLKGTGVNLGAGEAGKSFVVEDDGKGVYYYIKSLVYDEIFEIGLSISEDFDGEISNYEVYVNGERISEAKVPVEDTVRHFAFTIDNTESVKIRLYNGDEIVTDCEIDPTVLSAKLDVPTYTIDKDELTKVAEYTLNEENGYMSIHFVPKPGQMIAYYNIKSEDGTYLISDEKVPIDSDFSYLTVLAASLEDVTVCFYDDTEALLYECNFRTNLTIHKKEEANE